MQEGRKDVGRRERKVEARRERAENKNGRGDKEKRRKMRNVLAQMKMENMERVIRMPYFTIQIF